MPGATRMATRVIKTYAGVVLVSRDAARDANCEVRPGGPHSAAGLMSRSGMKVRVCPDVAVSLPVWSGSPRALTKP